jgi:hypothetical protein
MRVSKEWKRDHASGHIRMKLSRMWIWKSYAVQQHKEIRVKKTIARR